MACNCTVLGFIMACNCSVLGICLCPADRIDLDKEIKDCLTYFGPCMIRTIQEKLSLRGIDFSHIEILNACENMLKRNQIKEATGFHGRAFKT